MPADQLRYSIEDLSVRLCETAGIAVQHNGEGKVVWFSWSPYKAVRNAMKRAVSEYRLSMSPEDWSTHANMEERPRRRLRMDPTAATGTLATLRSEMIENGKKDIVGIGVTLDSVSQLIEQIGQDHVAE